VISNHCCLNIVFNLLTSLSISLSTLIYSLLFLSLDENKEKFSWNFVISDFLYNAAIFSKDIPTNGNGTNPAINCIHKANQDNFHHSCSLTNTDFLFHSEIY
jgi:hypothetical protein